MRAKVSKWFGFRGRQLSFVLAFLCAADIHSICLLYGQSEADDSTVLCCHLLYFFQFGI